MASALSYYKKKELARKLFGSCKTRPQAINRKFWIQRRKINYGIAFPPPETYDDNLKAWSIPKDLIQPQHLPFVITNNPEFTKVESDADLVDMMCVIGGLKVITLDLEGNREDSYLGMTCLIQIGTVLGIFLVDPFSMSTESYQALKKFLERQDMLIVMHGCANDIIWLKRDFGIYPVAVLDTQLMYQIIHRGDLIAFDRLLEIMVPELKSDSAVEKKVLQSADWHMRPIPARMLSYAAMDVFGLLFIWEGLKQQDPDGVYTNEAVQSTKRLLKNTYSLTLKSFDEEFKSLRKTPVLNEEDKSKLKLLWEFRNMHAKIVDVFPSNLMKMSVLVEIVRKQPTDTDQLGKIIMANRGMLQKSFKTMLSILREGKDFLEKIKAIQCNNCYRFGHAAFGCPEEYSKENTRRYYHMHPELKAKLNRVRRQNYKRNLKNRKEQA